MDNSVIHADSGAYSVDGFCNDHEISRAFFYQLVKCGQGPRLMKVGRRTLISKESAVDWRRDMEQKTSHVATSNHYHHTEES